MDLSLSSTIAQEIDRLKRPMPLGKVLGWIAEREGSSATVGELEQHFRETAMGSDPAYVSLAMRISAWDDAEEPDWDVVNPAGTRQRRLSIYQQLGLAPSFADALDGRIGLEGGRGGDVVISEPFRRWYGPEREAANAFYWTGYSRYLATARRFDSMALRALDQSTREVVERFADPCREDIAPKRGLVVGHVQSGKTAHFTGVIAKAIDAGYRLVIVLAGQIDLLRNQTQRRLDMELVGKEQIEVPEQVRLEGGAQDYWGDPDWDGFISYRTKPTPPHASPIVRLTGAGQDYRSLGFGATGLASERRRPDLPFNAPENLPYLPTHLVVVKKNSLLLRKLRRDLAALGPHFLRDIPALVIDDESDQASVNTVAPSKTAKGESKDEKHKTAINKAIVELLAKLPRAQYVGYTATPYANVLIDPMDIQDLFPRDFIVSLTPPPSYVGAAYFHDLTGERQSEDRGRRENAFVRNVWPDPPDKPLPPDGAPALREALDAFVLSGMLKLYREHATSGDLRFRHHTMLLHESSRKADHDALAQSVRGLWNASGYYGGRGVRRLSELFYEDFLPTSRELDLAYPMPEGFDNLQPFLGPALSKIEANGDAVLVVNSDYEGPDFDTQDVWRIIVGGQKLSRGYTIEGLTTSYFRRRAAHAEALMQMGRWFGFRPGYRDLVRLYIGRAEQSGKRSIDLLRLFEAALRDEEAFREGLSRYALTPETGEPIRPIDVQPLVYQSLPELRPTAVNKLYRSKLISQNFGGDWIESARATSDPGDMRINLASFESLLNQVGLERGELGIRKDGKAQMLTAFIAHITPDQFIDLLASLRWPDRIDSIGIELEYLRGNLRVGDPEIDGWFLVAPQLKGGGRSTPWRVAGQDLTVAARAWLGNGFNVFSGSSDRAIAKALAGIPQDDGSTATPCTDLASRLAGTPRHGVCLLYPTRSIDGGGPKQENGDEIITPGIAFAPPPNSHPKRTVFVADKRERSVDLIGQ